MSEVGISSIDQSVQETSIWLKALMEQLHDENRHHAYSALRAVLHALRDRLTPDSAVHLGAQLPMLIRGIYYEGWRIAEKPVKDRTVDEFAARIQEELPPLFPRDPVTTAKAVFVVLFDKLDPGATAKVVQQLPVPLRSLWPEQVR